MTKNTLYINKLNCGSIIPQFLNKLKKKIFCTYLNSSVSVESSCSICRKTCNISLIIIGHKDVTCNGLIRSKITRKQRNTWA